MSSHCSNLSAESLIKSCTDQGTDITLEPCGGIGEFMNVCPKIKIWDRSRMNSGSKRKPSIFRANTAKL